MEIREEIAKYIYDNADAKSYNDDPYKFPLTSKYLEQANSIINLIVKSIEGIENPHKPEDMYDNMACFRKEGFNEAIQKVIEEMRK